MSETSPELKAFFVLVFDPNTTELVVEPYQTVDAARWALFRHNDDGQEATYVEAEDEATLHATRDLEEIARELRQRWEEGEAGARTLKAIIAALRYPERRVLELCDSEDGPRLTHAEAAAEMGCSVRTVRRVHQQGLRKVAARLGVTG